MHKEYISRKRAQRNVHRRPYLRTESTAKLLSPPRVVSRHYADQPRAKESTAKLSRLLHPRLCLHRRRPVPVADRLGPKVRERFERVSSSRPDSQPSGSSKLPSTGPAAASCREIGCSSAGSPAAAVQRTPTRGSESRGLEARGGEARSEGENGPKSMSRASRAQSHAAVEVA